MRSQPQFDNDHDRNRRVDRESRKALMLMIWLIIAVPLILLLMGYIAMCGQKYHW